MEQTNFSRFTPLTNQFVKLDGCLRFIHDTARVLMHRQYIWPPQGKKFQRPHVALTTDVYVDISGVAVVNKEAQHVSIHLREMDKDRKTDLVDCPF